MVTNHLKISDPANLVANPKPHEFYVQSQLEATRKCQISLLFDNTLEMLTQGEQRKKHVKQIDIMVLRFCDIVFLTI